MNAGIQPAGYDSIITFLEGTLPFCELDRQGLTRIARSCLVDFLPAGTRLLRRGTSEVDGLLLIQKGAVRLFIEDEGVLVDIRTDGASIGALSLFNGEKAALDAETVEDTFLIKIPRDRFLKRCTCTRPSPASTSNPSPTPSCPRPSRKCAARR